MVKRKNIKRRDLIQLVLSILIVFLLNYIGSFVFKRFDLTTEKRYTLSVTTQDMLKNLDDIVYVKVYLDGKFPGAPGFSRLRDETKELLDEFRAFSEENIDYEFINPNDIPDPKQRNEFYRMLYNKGIPPTPLEVKTDKGTMQQTLFPGALVSYHGRETAVQLLKTQLTATADEQLNNSVQGLEYEFSNAIRKLGTPLKQRVAFTEGHKELDTLRTADIRQTLEEYYEVHSVRLNEDISALTERDTTSTGQTTLWNKYKLLIVAKPDSAFSEKDKFVLDQYIMNGGKVLWLIDPLQVNEDSLSTGFTLGMERDLNLTDLFFRYGVRLNNHLLQDMQCSYIKVNTAFIGTPPRFEPKPWLFAPLIQSQGNHPVVKNLDLIKFDFTGSIDTVAARGIKKTILLKSSRYTKTLQSPVRIAVAMVNITPDERQFTKSWQPVAVLLEGEFESAFRNRLTKEFTDRKEIAFREKSKPTKMIVIPDGDVIRNIAHRSTGKIFPLGFDLSTRQTFANKNFILNCVNYLLDDSGLMAVRAREIKLRLLDKKKVKNEAFRWKMFNTVLPVVVVVAYGMFRFYLRKRKYAN